MNYLERYINSKGQALPPEFYRYKAGGDKDHLCPFCQERNQSFPVLFFPTRGTTEGAHFTTAYMCWPCSEEVVLMESELLGPPVRGGLFDQIEDSARSRLELLAKFGKFDLSVDQHYIHLDPYAFPNSRCCYACKERTDNYLLVSAPVRGDSSQLSGGNVRICTSQCVPFAHAEYGLNLKMDTPQPHGPNLIAICAVPNCGDIYFIDPHEAEYRGSYKDDSINKHMCPACAYSYLVGSGANDGEPPNRGRLILDIDPVTTRYYEHECEYCTDLFLVDATLLPKLLIESFISRDKLKMCARCHGGIEGGPVHVSILGTTFIGYYPHKAGVRVIIKEQYAHPKDMIIHGNPVDIVQQVVLKYGRDFTSLTM